MQSSTARPFGESHPIITPETHPKTYEGDPLACLCIDRFQLTPLTAALTTLLLFLILDGLTLLFVGDYILELNGWSDVLTYSAYTYGVAPLIVAAYIWVSVASGRLFHELRHSDVIHASDEDYQTFLTGGGSLQAVNKHQFWLAVSLAITIAFAGFFMFPAGNSVSWSLGAIMLRAAKVMFLYVPIWYMVCQIVVRELVTIWGLRQLFKRFDIVPHPLHPDGCGGLHAINNYVVGFSYILALTGVGVVILLIASWLMNATVLSGFNILLIIAYCVLGMVFFFVPPWTAHAAMAQSKQKMLTDIARVFHEQYAQLTTALHDNVLENDQLMNRIQGLHGLYQLTDQFPVWPFDTRTLKRFVTLIVVPTIPVFIELIVRVISLPLTR